MIRELTIANLRTAEEVLRIQLAAYQIEARLIGFAELPPLRDTVTSLQHCTERFFGFYEGEELCGAIAIKLEGELVDIHRLMIDPKHFRKGIAKQLLRYVEHLDLKVNTLLVSTGAANTPAIKLYEQNGYMPVRTFDVEGGLALTSLEKTLRRKHT